MRQRFLLRHALLFVGLGLAPILASGCLPLAYALKDDCEDPECTGGGMYCSGGKLMECYYWEGDPCTYGTLSVVDDCTARGERCVEDHCEPGPPVVPPEHCPRGVDGVCRDNMAFHCEGGYLSAGEPCSGLGLACHEIVDRGNSVVEVDRVNAVCAISTERCPTMSYDGSDCLNGDRVLCHRGYPQASEPCEGENVTCVLYSQESVYERAQCTLSVPCPPGGGRLCSSDIVHGCENTSSTVRLRDCRSLGDHCVMRGDRSFCSPSAGEPPPARWLPIASGSFAPGPEPASAAVTVGAFEMMEKEATVGEYEACRASGACTELAAPCQTSYGETSYLKADLPVTCIDFSQAKAFCAHAGGRLPTELEWEYALRNAGMNVRYPWGDDDVSCDHAVVRSPGGANDGCGRGEPAPACTQPDDITAQGICDLAGNVEEWVERATTPPDSATRGLDYTLFGEPYQGALVSRLVGESHPFREVGVRCVR